MHFSTEWFLGETFYTGTKNRYEKTDHVRRFGCLGCCERQAQQVYAPAPGLTSTQLSKPWSVSAAIRGFYDDNYALTPSRGLVDPVTGARIEPRESYGYEVTPSVGLNWTMEQTYIGLSYLYSLKFFEDRPEHKYDQSHRLTSNSATLSLTGTSWIWLIPSSRPVSPT